MLIDLYDVHSLSRLHFVKSKWSVMVVEHPEAALALPNIRNKQQLLHRITSIHYSTNVQY